MKADGWHCHIQHCLWFRRRGQRRWRLRAARSDADSDLGIRAPTLREELASVRRAGYEWMLTTTPIDERHDGKEESG